MTDLIQHELDEGLLTLRLNRPDKLNALTNAMYTRLAELFESANSDPAVEVIVLTGSVECFTAGNDLPDFLDQPPTDLQSPVFRMMWAVLALDKPLIAAVAGPAIGIGTTLLLHCDQVLVSARRQVAHAIRAIGGVPGVWREPVVATAAGACAGGAVVAVQPAARWRAGGAVGLGE